MPAEAPLHGLRNSPLLGAVVAPPFHVALHHGMRIADRAVTNAPAGDFVVDISAIPRRLIAGGGAASWLATRGLPCPEELQSWVPLGAGGLIARVHYDQYLAIDQPAGGAAAPLFDKATGRHGDVLILDHDMAEIGLGGPARADILAELCAVELDPARDNWLNVRIAHCEVALWHLTKPVPHSRLQCLPADARYLFGVLHECIAAASGEVIGFSDYLRLAASPV